VTTNHESRITNYELRVARGFALLFATETLSRTLLATVLPLQALAELGDAGAVGLLFAAVGLASVAGSLLIPLAVHRRGLRFAFLLGVAGLFVSSLALASDTLTGLVLGMTVRVLAVVCAEVTLNLYVLAYIPRHAFTRFEPMRMFYLAGVWTLGPWLGVYLKSLQTWAPYALAALCALALLLHYRHLELAEPERRAQRPPPSPFKFVPRFFSQPRLALAWLLALGRAGWWVVFFVYAPIYAVQAGFTEVAAGAIVSLSSASTFLVKLWGWVARRYGVRRVLVGGYLASGLTSLALAAVAGLPWLAAAMLIVAALAASPIDGPGNVPFLRAVRSLERAEMTSVFLTYRDTAQLLPPALAAGLLTIFELPAVFVATGIGMLVLACYARYIPRRL